MDWFLYDNGLHYERVSNKSKVNFKIYDVTNCITNNYNAHIISRSKDNQTIKFDHLIEYNIRNIFYERSYEKCVGESSPKLFFKKSKLSISLDQQSEVSHSLF